MIMGCVCCCSRTSDLLETRFSVDASPAEVAAYLRRPNSWLRVIFQDDGMIHNDIKGKLTLRSKLVSVEMRISDRQANSITVLSSRRIYLRKNLFIELSYQDEWIFKVDGKRSDVNRSITSFQVSLSPSSSSKILVCLLKPWVLIYPWAWDLQKTCRNENENLRQVFAESDSKYDDLNDDDDGKKYIIDPLSKWMVNMINLLHRVIIKIFIMLPFKLFWDIFGASASRNHHLQQTNAAAAAALRSGSLIQPTDQDEKNAASVIPEGDRKSVGDTGQMDKKNAMKNGEKQERTPTPRKHYPSRPPRKVYPKGRGGKSNGDSDDDDRRQPEKKKGKKKKKKEKGNEQRRIPKQSPTKFVDSIDLDTAIEQKTTYRQQLQQQQQQQQQEKQRSTPKRSDVHLEEENSGSTAETTTGIGGRLLQRLPAAINENSNEEVIHRVHQERKYDEEDAEQLPANFNVDYESNQTPTTTRIFSPLDAAAKLHFDNDRRNREVINIENKKREEKFREELSTLDKEVERLEQQEIELKERLQKEKERQMREAAAAAERAKLAAERKKAEDEKKKEHHRKALSGEKQHPLKAQGEKFFKEERKAALARYEKLKKVKADFERRYDSKQEFKRFKNGFKLDNLCETLETSAAIAGNIINNTMVGLNRAEFFGAEFKDYMAALLACRVGRYVRDKKPKWSKLCYLAVTIALVTEESGKPQELQGMCKLFKEAIFVYLARYFIYILPDFKADPLKYEEKGEEKTMSIEEFKSNTKEDNAGLMFYFALLQVHVDYDKKSFLSTELRKKRLTWNVTKLEPLFGGTEGLWRWIAYLANHLSSNERPHAAATSCLYLFMKYCKRSAAGKFGHQWAKIERLLCSPQVHQKIEDCREESILPFIKGQKIFEEGTNVLISGDWLKQFKAETKESTKT